MKKISAAVAALAITGLLLAGCGNNNEAVTETTTGSVTESVTEATEETTEASDETVDDTTEASNETVDTDDTADDITDGEETDSSDDTVLMPMFDEENVNPLQNLVLATMGDFSDWPSLSEVSDEFILSDYFLLDKNNPNYEQLIVMQCPMSAVMCEIIIIKADDVDAAKADLEARQKKAQDTDAFYPDDIERAGNSIVGTKGDYAYFLICENPPEAEELLTAAIE